MTMGYMTARKPKRRCPEEEEMLKEWKKLIKPVFKKEAEMIELRDGMRIRCKIRGVDIPDALVSYQDGSYYALHNVIEKNGGAPLDKKGFGYSWYLGETSTEYQDNGLTDIEVLGKITIDDLQVGDIIKSRANKLKVLGKAGEVWFLSMNELFDCYGTTYTLKQLKNYHYEIVSPDEPEKSKWVVNEVMLKATEESLEHHKENLRILKEGKEYEAPFRRMDRVLGYAFAVGNKRVNLSADSCALCKLYIKDGCFECPLRRIDDNCGKNASSWHRIANASTIDEAIKTEKDMVKSLQKAVEWVKTGRK